MSDIIYTPPASGGGGTTINPTNNFIPKRSNATTFVDSVLENGSNYLYSNYGGYTGLGLDFLNFVSYLGDWNNLINGTTLVVSDATSNIYTKYNGFGQGISLDFFNNTYLFGTFANTNLFLDANNNYVSINVGGDQYLLLDKLNQNATFFDYSNGNGLEFSLPNKTFFLNVGNGIVIEADYNSGYLILGNPIQPAYISMEFNAGRSNVKLGDVNAQQNATYMIIDDLSQEILSRTENLVFQGTNIQSNSSGGNSGEHLVITLNGNQYKIKLENP